MGYLYGPGASFYVGAGLNNNKALYYRGTAVMDYQNSNRNDILPSFMGSALSEISVVRIILALSIFLPTIPSSLMRQSSAGRQALSVIPTTESRLHLRPDKEEFI